MVPDGGPLGTQRNNRLQDKRGATGQSNRSSFNCTEPGQATLDARLARLGPKSMKHWQTKWSPETKLVITGESQIGTKWNTCRHSTQSRYGHFLAKSEVLRPAITTSSCPTQPFASLRLRRRRPGTGRQCNDASATTRATRKTTQTASRRKTRTWQLNLAQTNSRRVPGARSSELGRIIDELARSWDIVISEMRVR
jgi:hypothetical protein